MYQATYRQDAEGQIKIAGIFAAVPYGINRIGGPNIETREAAVEAFRPSSALRQE